ncbi:hypothetical protein V8C86DRAFT_116166 [Haematococcus lacustris]
MCIAPISATGNIRTYRNAISGSNTAAVSAAGVSAQATDVTLTPSPPILALRPPAPPRPPPKLEPEGSSATPLLLTYYGLDMWSLVTGSGIQALLEAQQPPSLSLQGLSAPGMCASQLLALNTTALLNTSLTAQELMPGLAYFTADVAQLLRDFLQDSSITVQVTDFCAGNRTFASFSANRTLVNGTWPTLNVTLHHHPPLPCLAPVSTLFRSHSQQRGNHSMCLGRSQ